MKKLIQSVKLRCLLLLLMGFFISSVLIIVKAGEWGSVVMLLFAALAVLYGVGESNREITRGLAAIQNGQWDLNAKMIVEEQISRKLSAQFPDVELPITIYSMMPVNLWAIVELLEEKKPELIVELGSGISTLIIGTWLKRNGNGRLISIEHDAAWAAKSHDLIEEHQIQDFVEIVHAPLVEQIQLNHRVHWYDLANYSLASTGISLLIVDGPPAQYPMARVAAVSYFYSQLKTDAVVFLDDGHRPDERKMVKEWVNAYPDLVPQYSDTFTGYWILRKQPSRK